MLRLALLVAATVPAAAFVAPSALPGGSCTVGAARARGLTAVQGMSCKNIAVFGGTGGVGLETIYQSLNQGDKVRALVRSPDKVVVPPGSGGEARSGQPLTSTDLTVVQGDVTSAADVTKVFEGDVDQVVIALGGRTKEVGTEMLTLGTKNIIAAMKEKGVSRVSVVTSIGAGESYDQAPLVFKFAMWTILKDAFVDKNRQEALFLDPGAPGVELDYVIVRPGGLTTGPPSGQFKVLSASEMAGSIARADVASFCLSAPLDGAYLRKAVCIS